jgi:hypothetical protein
MESICHIESKAYHSYIKRSLLIALIILQVISSYSQINKDNISFELRYPLPLGDNFLNKGPGNSYTGIIDFGIDYNFIQKNGFGMGVILNTSLLRFSFADVNLFILSPKVKFDYEIKVKKLSIIPQIAFGYCNYRFRAPSRTLTDEYGNPLEAGKYKKNENGVVMKAGTKVVLNSDRKLNWYLQMAYEFTRLEKPDDPAIDSKYNRNTQLLYPGIGVIWRFK